MYKNNCGFVLNQRSLLCLLASDFPSENPRTQTRNFPYTNTLAVIWRNHFGISTFIKYNLKRKIMKLGKLSLLLFLGLVLFTSCSNDDDNSTELESLNGIWNVKNISGGIAGIDNRHETGIITWTFDNQTLTVENNSAQRNIYNGFESGTYSYLLLEDENEQFINLNESGDYLKIIFANNEMILDPDDSRWLENGEIIQVSISDSYTFKFER